MTTFILYIPFHPDEKFSYYYVADTGKDLSPLNAITITEEYDDAMRFASEAEAKKIAEKWSYRFENGIQVLPHYDEKKGVPRITRWLD